MHEKLGVYHGTQALSVLSKSKSNYACKKKISFKILPIPKHIFSPKNTPIERSMYGALYFKALSHYLKQCLGGRN